MDSHEKLAKLLEASSSFLGWAAREIAVIPFEPKKQNLEIAVQAISAISELTRALYKERPDLIPKLLQLEIPQECAPQDICYGPDNPMPPELMRVLEIKGAIEMLECFEVFTVNSHLTKIAKEQLPILRNLLKEQVQTASDLLSK
ncbi:MAG TPA: hypothetical protein VIF82_04380 [Burkholderiaceae bacterium]|jgi:hypothetical protein